MYCSALATALRCTKKRRARRVLALAGQHKGWLELIGFLGELWDFMRVRKKFWLAPILMMLLLFGGLVVLSQGSAVAPFIYTIF